MVEEKTFVELFKTHIEDDRQNFKEIKDRLHTFEGIHIKNQGTFQEILTDNKKQIEMLSSYSKRLDPLLQNFEKETVYKDVVKTKFESLGQIIMWVGGVAGVIYTIYQIKIII